MAGLVKTDSPTISRCGLFIFLQLVVSLERVEYGTPTKRFT